MEHWDWGAVEVSDAPEGWKCEHCAKRPSKKGGGGRHVMPDGGELCTSCARALWDAA